MCYKITFFIFAIIAGVFSEANPAAKPAIITPIAYTAPVVVDAPVVTAHSSQFISRNYNGIAAPLVTAPVAYTASAYSPYYAVPYTYAINSGSPLKYRSIVPAPIKYTSAVLV